MQYGEYLQMDAVIVPEKVCEVKLVWACQKFMGSSTLRARLRYTQC